MIKQDVEYNGWTNYETWNVKLWIDNDQASLELWQDQASDILAKHGTREAVSVLATHLEAKYDEGAYSWIDDRPPCCFSDLLLASLREVNWQEIAYALLEDVQAEN